MESESSFGNELSDFERELIRSLREKGIYCLYTKNLFLAWTLEQERLVDQSGDYQTAQIRLNLRRARLYFEAGYLNEAFEDFEHARIQALNLENRELYSKIVQEIHDKFG